jgi:predicted NBD/HSP70 family sugar kinase
VTKLRLAVVGVPGAPDNRTGRVLLAPNIRDFDSMDVLEAFRRALGFDVVLENDVNLAALGESWQGQGQGIDNLAYVALGTGIGSGLILGGQSRAWGGERRWRNGLPADRRRSIRSGVAARWGL